MSPPRRKPAVIRETTRRQPSGLVGWLARLSALVLLLWLGGFLWFSLSMPGPEPKATKTDAVVVLTGGKGRLKRGLAVIEAGGARRMLISGVDRGTTRKQLAAAAGVAKQRLAAADLVYEAVDTKSNAEETARWAARNKFESIRLVTSAGHMRRARLELARVLPADVTVVEDAVPVEPTAPSMYMAPWLKLTTPMTPKMTASPRAARA